MTRIYLHVMTTSLVATPVGSQSGPTTLYTFAPCHTNLHTLMFLPSPLTVAAKITDGSYVFIQNLLALESVSAPSNFPTVRSLGFLPERRWDPFLKTLPDPQFADFLRRGIRNGFHVGVSPSATLVSSKANSPSALALASMVDDYIKEDVKAGNLAHSPCEGVHLSPIGFIPMKNWPGKFRLIVNLSFPSGNSAISPAHSFRYVTMRQEAKLMPQGSSLAKIDPSGKSQSTSQTSRDLLEGPHPLRQGSHVWPQVCPYIFNAVADGLAWAMICSNIIDLAHYVDDFIFWSADHATCQQTLVAQPPDLGSQSSQSRSKVPQQPLPSVNSISRELRLSLMKLACLKSTLFEWCSKKSTSKHNLQVFIGLLCDAAQVVPAGRLFIRSLIDAMSRLNAANHITRLDQGCKDNLAWCINTLRLGTGQAYSPTFQMVPLLPLMSPAPGELELSFFWTTPGSRFNGPTHGPQPILLQRSSCPLSLHWLYGSTAVRVLKLLSTPQLCNASRPNPLKTAISPIFSAAFSSSLPSMT